MTVTTSAGSDVEKRDDLVTVTIDGFEVSVPPGTLLIRAAELLGIQVPRFCDHPLLDPVGACRQCLVEVTDAGNGRGMPKPQASCTIPVAPGMVVKTQLTSPVADKAQQGIMEFLLINHPLDCPICDKAGECPLQNQALSNGRSETRFIDVKRTYPKPINISSQVLLDRERCVLCARCTRFSNQIAGDPFIEMLERGALQQVGIYEQKPFESYFSGNTIQICPVGALTSAMYRFRSRPFDLISSPTVCEHCASGCSLRSDHRRNVILRRLAGDDPEVNEEWNCDKGRWGFRYGTRPDRLTHPLVRDASGELVAASWPEALTIAANGLAAARGRAGVLAGGRLTLEDAYAYGKFARLVLQTNDVDFRARAHSAEEADFLASTVAGSGMGVTYADLEKAPAILLVGFEPEEESPIVFLRLRKAAVKKHAAIFAVAPYETSGLTKLLGTLITAGPGEEARVLGELTGSAAPVATALAAEGAVILVGERLAASPGALAAAQALAASTGARLAWVPRRAGERGAVEAGLLPGVLPGGRNAADPSAHADLGRVWPTPVPTASGRDGDAMLAAARAGELGALVVAGVEVDDLPDPHAARAALDAVPFLVSLEVRESEVTRRADVVLPVAAASEKGGTFMTWEGRPRTFSPVLRNNSSLTDARVLHILASEMDADLGLADLTSIRRELDQLLTLESRRLPTATTAALPPPAGARPPEPAPGEARVATWRLLLDNSRGLDGDPYLAQTARPAVARVSAATAAEVGVASGDLLTVTSAAGTVTLPVEITDLPDRTVWMPGNSGSTPANAALAARVGDTVRLSAGGIQ